MRDRRFFKRKILGGYSQELIRGVASVAGLRVLGVFIGYAFVLLVARMFGASALGQYQLTVQLVGTCALFSALGFNQLALKYSSRSTRSEEAWGEFRKIGKKWALLSALVAILFSSLLMFFSEEVAEIFFNDVSARKYILVASVLVPFQVLTNLSVQVLRGIGLIPLSEFLRSIHVRVVNIAALAALLLLFGKKEDFVVISFFIASLSAFLAVLLVVWSRFKKGVNGNQGNAFCGEEMLTLKSSLSQSFPMYQSTILIFVSTQALVYILAYFEGPAEVAKYNVALQVANLANFIFASVVTVSAPMYSRDYQVNRQKFKASISESSRMIFWASGSASLIIGVFSYPILLVFGEDFAGSWYVLAILAAANFVNAFTGASGNLLDMTGGHAVRKNILLINAVMTVSIAFFAIKTFGVAGVALCYFFNMCFGNFIGVYVVYKRTGINMMYIPLVSGRS